MSSTEETYEVRIVDMSNGEIDATVRHIVSPSLGAAKRTARSLVPKVSHWMTVVGLDVLQDGKTISHMNVKNRQWFDRA